MRWLVQLANWYRQARIQASGLGLVNQAMEQVDVDRIIGQWSRAAIEPSRWGQALASVAEALGAPSAVLFTPETDPKGRAMSLAHGTAAAAFHEYVAHWIGEDPWFREIQARRIAHPAGNVSFGRQLIEPSRLRRTGFYNDFAARHGIHDALSLVLCDGSDTTAPVTRLSLHRAHRQHDFDSTHQHALRTLWPHLQRAVRAHWMLRHAHESARIAEETLDAVPQPAWILAEGGGIAFANVEARELMRGRSWLRCGHGRLLRIGQVDVPKLLLDHRGADAIAPARLAVAYVADDRLQRATAHINRIDESPRFMSVWPPRRCCCCLTCVAVSRSLDGPPHLPSTMA